MPDIYRGWGLNLTQRGSRARICGRRHCGGRLLRRLHVGNRLERGGRVDGTIAVRTPVVLAPLFDQRGGLGERARRSKVAQLMGTRL